MIKKLYIRKLAGITSLIILIFLITGCDDDPKDPKENKILIEATETQYKNTVNVFNEKVYTRNKNTTKISQAYLKYAEPHDVDVFFPLLGNKVSIGSGNLINGVLDFTVLPEKIKEENLLEWDLFKSFFTSGAGTGAWINVDVIKLPNTEIKGNLLLLDAYTLGDVIGGMIDRQRIIGDQTSLSCETILYFYLNEDCTISGNRGSGYRYGESYYRAGNELNLPLKKGWNLVTRTEKYNTDISGYQIISMEIKPIKNPQDYKWVIETGFRL